MVLGGVKIKSRRNPTTVNVDYLIHILDIKPWPPTPSLKTLRSVLIQWENGDRSSGTTAVVVPELDKGKIEFNETFKLAVTFSREIPIKPGGDSDTFQKNCLEFNLYEPRRDKSVKGQLLGTAIIDLAEYGVVRESLSVSTIVNCQRNFRNTAQPILYVKIEKVSKKGQSGGLFREGSVTGALLDKNGGESVSALMREEYAEEADMASATDDDGSSHSSLNVSSSSAGMSNEGSPPQNDENSSDIVKDDTGQGTKDITVSSERSLKISDTITSHENQQGSFSCSSSIDLSSRQENRENGNGSLSNSSESSTRINEHRDIDQEVPGKVEYDINESEASVDPSFLEHTLNLEDKNVNVEHEKENNIIDEDDQVLKDTPISRFPQDSSPKRISLGNDPLSYSTVNRLRHVKSVRSLSDSSKSNGLLVGNQFPENSKEINNAGDAHTGSRKASKAHPKDASESKIQQLEQRIKMLEGELREAAAVEVALYSVVAEHGSSMSKVHAPARRLSRLYLHACKEKPLSRRANAARAAVSGIRLVAKACGNDVPRLTFWLSNSVMLRIIISQAIGDSELPVSSGPSIERSDIGKAERPSPLKWESSSSMRGSVKGWEDLNTFTSALEKIEAWIFSRIIESVWWQTLTPHMQSAAAKAINEGVGFNSSKCCRRASILGDQEKVSLSLDLWKKAFQDARERLCPVRAGGHECGCLPLLTKLIMEQCVARLDVAMLNAILRESDDEIPTDPISDPISDPKVLPIPAGQFSVGAGAQLKNAIGNWSRLLSDLFGMDDAVSLGDESDQNDDNETHISSFKSFGILNALSDLMMLPKDMLLSRSIRKEVCPTFGGTLIKRVINSFVPDEFCPDPVPENVLEALNSEDTLENEEFVTNFPCMAAPTFYLPPTAASIAHIVGELKSPDLRRSGSSVMRKSYTSEDELDELDSPLTCIITDHQRDSPKLANSNWMTIKTGTKKAIRYQLLREVWMESDV